jgi:hypothetical protein
MAVKSDYKFKPYTPVNLKMASPKGASLSQQEKTLKSLQAQKANLNQRLAAEGIDPDTLGGEFDNRNLIEKGLNLRPNQGLLMDFFEVINRPVEAIKGALVSGVEGQNVLEGFWEGISGQEVIRGSEFLKRTTGIEPETGVGKFIADVGIDIALDPLTYLPAGFFIKKFSSLNKLGGKTILKEVTQEGLETAAKKAAADYIDNLAARAAKENISVETIVARDLNNKDVLDVILFDTTDAKLDDLMQANPKLKARVEELAEMKASGTRKGKPIKGATQSELKAYNSLYTKIEAIDPNLKVILNKTSDRYDDVAIFYKTKIDGKDALVKLRGIEVKNMVSKADKAKAAFFSNIMLDTSGDAAVLTAGTTVSARTKGIMENAFNNVVMKDGSTLGVWLKNKAEAMRKAQSVGTKVDDISIMKNLSPEGQKTLRGMFEEITRGSTKAVTFLDTPAGGKLVKLEDMLDNLDESFGLLFDKAQNQIRFNTGFKIKNLDNLEAVPDATEGLIKELSAADPVTRTEEVFITLAGRAREGEFGQLAQKISVSAKKLEINFKNTFNLTAGFSDETKNLIKAAFGENLFELERRSARLAEIQQQLIKVNPEAGKLLGEIIEAGAKVVDGKIVKMSRSMGLSDFLDYSLKRLEDGAEIILPSFPDDAAKLNFLKNLNKRYQDAFSTTDDLFEVVVGKQGGTVLRVKGDASDLKEIIKQYGDEKLIRPIAGVDDYVQFGERALSKEAQRLLLSQTDLIGDYSSLSDEILQELIDVAGFDKLPSELAGQIGYMRHVMSKEAYAGLQRQLPGVASLFARPGSDTLAQRTFLGSAEEINAAMKEFMNLEMDLFDPNAFNAMEDLIKVAQRKLDQSRILDIVLKETSVEGDALMKVVANTQDARSALSPYDTMFKSFKEEFSALYKNLSPDGQAQLDAFFKAGGYGTDKAIAMNKSAYNILKGAEKAYIQIPELVKTYDKFLNTWKGVTLVSPGFHLRNMFGNMFNSYAIGMDTVAQSKYLGVAMTELDEFNKIGKKLAQGLDISPAEQKVFDTVRGYFEHGASQTHRGIRDLEQLKEATSAAAKGGKIKTGYNNLLKFNFNVAEKIDDVQRYALYRWSFDKTNDVNKAARTVSEALFDYSHLTPFEKNYMKRIFPFYTFMKNNFIFQAKNIFANPKQYARAGRAYNYAVENLSGYSQDDLPEYATENMWLPLPISVNKNDKEGIAFLKANLPLSDFTEFVENPFRKGVTSLTAPVKLIIEFGAGRDLFTGAPLQAFPGQKNAMEAGTGVLSGLRDQRGNLTISQSPLFQKIINDIGLRTPVNLASAGLDIVDTLAGYQGPKEGLGDFMVRAGILGVQEADRMELTKLYQDLEKLRNLKKYYEQETGNQLPVLPR